MQVLSDFFKLASTDHGLAVLIITLCCLALVFRIAAITLLVRAIRFIDHHYSTLFGKKGSPK